MEGQLFVWGSADAGRLGLGMPFKDKYVPVLVKTLRQKRIAHVSCGSAHTVAVSEIQTVYEGRGSNRIRVYKGGDVFVCGAAAVLKRLQPTFVQVASLSEQVMHAPMCARTHARTHLLLAASPSPSTHRKRR